MAEAPRQKEMMARGWRLRCWARTASAITGTPTPRAASRASAISRNGAVPVRARTSWASELAQARVMLATDARRVRKMAVVTVVNRRPSARERSGPKAARAPRR